MGENKHLTPVWIVYVDGKRLDTDHEGALERIVIDDKLNGVGTGVLEFDSSMIKIRDSGTFYGTAEHFRWKVMCQYT